MQKENDLLIVLLWLKILAFTGHIKIVYTHARALISYLQSKNNCMG